MAGFDGRVLTAGAEFGLGVVSAAEPAGGSGACWRVWTSLGEFFVKAGQQETTVRLERDAAVALRRHGLRAAAVLVRPDGSLLSSDGCAVSAWLPGEPVAAPNERQFGAHLRYLGRYLRALWGVPTGRYDPPDSVWERALDPRYVAEHVPRCLAGLPADVVAAAERALSELDGRAAELAALPRQLVHVDVGPGNVLYAGGEPTAIIDFTPAFDSPVYALCVSLFWHRVYRGEPVHLDDALAQFGRHLPLSAEELALAPTMLLRAAAYRLFARILANAEGASFSPESLRAMAAHTQRCAHLLHSRKR